MQELPDAYERLLLDVVNGECEKAPSDARLGFRVGTVLGYDNWAHPCFHHPSCTHDPYHVYRQIL